MSAFYLWINEAKTGPYSGEEVRAFLRSGGITGETLCCREGGEDWAPCSTLPAQDPETAATPADVARRAVGPYLVAGGPAAGLGRWMVRGAVLSLAVGLVLTGVAVVMGLLDDEHWPRAMAWGAGVMLGLAVWLFVVGQVVLIREAVERMAPPR
jgi:hypothetical protein